MMQSLQTATRVLRMHQRAGSKIARQTYGAVSLYSSSRQPQQQSTRVAHRSLRHMRTNTSCAAKVATAEVATPSRRGMNNVRLTKVFEHKGRGIMLMMAFTCLTDIF
eukprot:7070568-Pyramimonas_sp.AAC.1